MDFELDVKLSLSLIFSAYTPISINKNCPKARGQFPATACNKFINCWDGIAIEQECNPGLLFNPKGFCDYPFNVDCNGKPIVTGTYNFYNK